MQRMEEKNEERLDSILKQCLSDAERVSVLKTELAIQSSKIGKHRNTNDSMNEKLRIKERELRVQYEENDRLKHNYNRLTKRIKSLQEEIKEKKKSKGIFSNFFSDKNSEFDEKDKQVTLLQDQLTRTINENENLNRKIENQNRASKLEQQKLENSLSEAEAKITSNENELRDLRELTEKYSDQVRRHASSVSVLKEEIKNLKTEKLEIEKELKTEREGSSYFRDCLRRQIAILEDENIDFVECINIAENVKNFILVAIKNQAKDLDFYEGFVEGESEKEEFELIKASSKNEKKKISDCIVEIFEIFCFIVKASENENLKELKNSVKSLKEKFEIFVGKIKGMIVLMKKVNIILFEGVNEFNKRVKEFENLVLLLENIFKNNTKKTNFRQNFGLLVEKISSFLGETDIIRKQKLSFFLSKGAKEDSEDFELWKEIRTIEVQISRKFVVEIFKLNNSIPSLYEYISSLVTRKEAIEKLSQTESLIISSILKFQSKKKNERQKLKNLEREYKKEIENLQKELIRQKSEIEDKKGKLIEKDEKIQGLKKQNKEALEEIKNNLNEKEAQSVEKLNSELQNSRNENLELQNSVSNLKSEIEEQKETNIELSRKLSNIKEEMKEKNKLINDLSLSLANGESAIEEKNSKINELKSKNLNLENEKESIKVNYENQITDLSEKLVELMTKQANA